MGLGIRGLRTVSVENLSILPDPDAERGNFPALGAFFPAIKYLIDPGMQLDISCPKRPYLSQVLVKYQSNSLCN
jgi:hypothetical protein